MKHNMMRVMLFLAVASILWQTTSKAENIYLLRPAAFEDRVHPGAEAGPSSMAGTPAKLGRADQLPRTHLMLQNPAGKWAVDKVVPAL